MDLKENLEPLRRSSIGLHIIGKGACAPGKTRLGGQPDVPPDFVWPRYEDTETEDAVINRPLSFLAQFDCAELAQYDCEHLLPDHGVLSFFYERYSEPWGFDPKDAGCSRVYWFEDSSVLTQAEYPADMPEACKLPILHIRAQQESTLPLYEDFSELWPDTDYDEFEAAQIALGISEDGAWTKLLGWPDPIQCSMPVKCELVSQGYYDGGRRDNIPEDVLRRAKEIAMDKWLLLFQLSSIEQGDFELMFGDCGRIYFYIPREDLLAHRFDRVWLILQCY